MKKILDYEITDGAINKIEEILGLKIYDISNDKLKYAIEKSEELIVCGNNIYIFIEEDMNAICKLGELPILYEVKELDRYFTEYCSDGLYYNEGIIGDDDCFYSYICRDAEDIERAFAESVDDITWYETDNELYRMIEEKMNQIYEEDKNNSIILAGNGLGIDVERALYLDEDYKDVKFSKMGYYAGKLIYRVNDKLYYLSDISYTFNTEYYFYLVEVGDNVYKYFE